LTSAEPEPLRLRLFNCRYALNNLECWHGRQQQQLEDTHEQLKGPLPSHRLPELLVKLPFLQKKDPRG
jgi:hypothetical protein